MSLRTLLKTVCYPWAGVGRQPIAYPQPYFGPPAFGLGGPALKRQKLIDQFGNHWARANLIYVTSGIPMNPTFLRWSKRRGAKILLNQDGVFTPSWAGNDYPKGNAILTELHEMADQVIYQSRFCQDTARRYLSIPARQRSELLYNGVDLDRFTPADDMSPATAMTVLCAGYFYPAKHYILNALLDGFELAHAQHPGLQLLIAGRIEPTPGTAQADDAWVDQACRARHLPEGIVRCRPAYRYAEAPEIMRAGGLFIHLKNNDPCPSIVLEALACGLPVVHCRNGGTPELVGDAGVAIDHAADTEGPDAAPSAEKISGAILQAVRNRQVLSALARQRAGQFSQKSWYKRHAELMTDMVGGSRHAA